MPKPQVSMPYLCAVPGPWLCYLTTLTHGVQYLYKDAADHHQVVTLINDDHAAEFRDAMAERTGKEIPFIGARMDQ